MTTGSLKKFTLGTKERLKSKKKIQALFSLGKVTNISPFRVIHLLENDNTPLQFGVAVGTRQFKKAVDRNRIKRLIREVYRLQKNELKELLVTKQKSLSFFIIYTGKTIPEYGLMFDKMGKTLQKLAEEINAQT